MLATKARFRMGEGPNDAGLSRHHLIEACEASLRRLRTDRIDLYQLHEWDGLTPLEETLEALDALVRPARSATSAASNFSGWHLMKALAVADRRGLPRFVSQQIHYTLQAREAEYELVPVSIDQGLGILVWSPIAGGLLSGKYRRGRPQPEGRQLAGWGEPPVRDEEKLYDIVEALVAVAEPRGVSAAQVALAWLLGRPGVTSLIVGARTDEQLADNLKAAGLKLTRRGAGAAGRGERAAAALPLLAPGAGGLGPAERGGPVAARAAPLGAVGGLPAEDQAEAALAASAPQVATATAAISLRRSGIMPAGDSGRSSAGPGWRSAGPPRVAV